MPAAAGLLLPAAAARAEDPASLIWNPASIRWQRFDKDGSKYAVLEGDREIPGRGFTYAFWLPDGVWVNPHWHTEDARVVVVRGTLLLGFGTKLDKEDVTAIGPGGYFVVRAKQPHYEAARGDTLIIGAASGVWRTHEVE